ncbi:hypothetical protein COLO4_33544 [Corchorus olitorius]|uniref:Zinc finger, CCHC-type n=1 Tax=Corchorus olitorius TaxID=93759 RepID=A0A1R3GSR5_9ROSI|nr:hypothetical protein COLO4_33544 [Corchorus olitorius]
MSDYFNLPKELFVEILLRLRIQDLGKFTVVCKSWNSFIKTPTFISTRLNRTISSTNTNLLFFRLYTSKPRRWPESPRLCLRYSLRFDNKALDEYKKLPCPKIGKCRRFRVAGSINGLVCLVYDIGPYDYTSDELREKGYVYEFSEKGLRQRQKDFNALTFILWNSVIKKAIHLPEPARYGSCILLNLKLKFTLSMLIFWRSITSIAPNYSPLIDPPNNHGNSFVNHGNSFVILAFDVSDEVFSEIPLPDNLSYVPDVGRAQLLKYGESSIAIVNWDWEHGRGLIHLWVMKEYGVATSWTKMLTTENQRVSRVLFFRQDEEAFVTRSSGWIASLGIKSNHLENLGESEGNRQRESMEEDLIVDLEVEGDSGREDTRFGLIGKIISDRVLNRRGVMNVMQSIWPAKALLKTVMGHCLCLRRWDLSLAVREIKFEEVSFWAQVHNLPLELMTCNNARRIGISLGRVIEVEDPNWLRGFGRSFLRIKIVVNVSKPLIGKFKTSRGSGDFITAEVKYEKLGDFCYQCGMLGHSEKNCERSGGNITREIGKGKYGPWMRGLSIRSFGRKEEVSSGRDAPDLVVGNLEPSNNHRGVETDDLKENNSIVVNREERVMERGEGSGSQQTTVEDHIERGVAEWPCSYYIEEDDPSSNQIPNQTVPKTPTKKLFSSPLVSQSSPIKSPPKNSIYEVFSPSNTQQTPKKRSLTPPISDNLQCPILNDDFTITSPLKKHQTLRDITNSLNKSSPIHDQTLTPQHRHFSRAINLFPHPPNNHIPPNNPILSNPPMEYTVELPPEDDNTKEVVCHEMISQQLVPILRNLSLKRSHSSILEEGHSNYRQKARQVELYEIAQKIFNVDEEEDCRVEEVQRSICIESSSNDQKERVTTKKMQKQRRVVRRKGKSRGGRLTVLEQESLWEAPVSVSED